MNDPEPPDTAAPVNDGLFYREQQQFAEIGINQQPSIGIDQRTADTEVTATAQTAIGGFGLMRVVDVQRTWTQHNTASQSTIELTQKMNVTVSIGHGQ